MSERPGRYLAYLLRLWRVGEGQESVWRASVESPHSGERLWFGSLAALFAFLTERTKPAQAQIEPNREEP